MISHQGSIDSDQNDANLEVVKHIIPSLMWQSREQNISSWVILLVSFDVNECLLFWYMVQYARGTHAVDSCACIFPGRTEWLFEESYSGMLCLRKEWRMIIMSGVTRRLLDLTSRMWPITVYWEWRCWRRQVLLGRWQCGSTCYIPHNQFSETQDQLRYGEHE